MYICIYIYVCVCVCVCICVCVCVCVCMCVCVRQFSDVIADKKSFFNTKYVSSNNIVCKAVSAWTLN